LHHNSLNFGNSNIAIYKVKNNKQTQEFLTLKFPEKKT